MRSFALRLDPVALISAPAVNCSQFLSRGSDLACSTLAHTYTECRSLRHSRGSALAAAAAAAGGGGGGRSGNINFVAVERRRSSLEMTTPDNVGTIALQDNPSNHTSKSADCVTVPRFFFNGISNYIKGGRARGLGDGNHHVKSGGKLPVGELGDFVA